MNSIEDQSETEFGSKNHIFAKVAALILLVLTLLFIWFLLSSSSKATTENKCPNLGKCSLKDFSTPPLVILSLDGFSREYLERGIFKSLDQIKICGATAEFVYPSFPTKTFPNHFTIATGVYPESHGIVDNEFYNEEISQAVWRASNNETFMDVRYIKAEPAGLPPFIPESSEQIRLYSNIQPSGARNMGEVRCCFPNPYVATGGESTASDPRGFRDRFSNHISGMKPLLGGFEYNKTITLENKLDKTIEGLKMPSDRRPGLIMVYHNEPDDTGHNYANDTKVVNTMLSKIEEQLQTFLKQLGETGLLDCINLLIVSDHGMQEITKNIYLNKTLNVDGMKIISGPSAKIYKGTSNLTDDEVMKGLTEIADGDFQIYSRNELPTRMHQASTVAVGDFNIIGKPGVAILENEDSWHATGSHGYDYLDKSMHTIFFAQGPSIRKGIVLPPFQNIEYLNLFRDLLGLPSYPNNGTLGVMDEVLVNPPKRKNTSGELVRECQQFTDSTLTFCGECDFAEKNRLILQIEACSKDRSVPYLSSDRPLCYNNYCNRSLIVGQNDNFPILWELVSNKAAHIDTHKCFFTKTNVTSGCSIAKISLSAQPNSDLNGMQENFADLSPGFVETVLNPLNNWTTKVAEEYGTLIVVSGLSSDFNMDGKKDANNSSPTHFYRILLRCDSKWSNDGICKKEDSLHVFAFIFPLIEKNQHNLNDHELLLEYSARLKDVELIAGFELEIPNVSMKMKNLLRTNIHLKLWETK